MPATVIITKNQNAAVSVENLPSGNVEIALESMKLLDTNRIESVRAIFSREELVEIRDAINEALLAF
jgi:hypothetical protein